MFTSFPAISEQFLWISLWCLCFPTLYALKLSPHSQNWFFMLGFRPAPVIPLFESTIMHPVWRSEFFKAGINARVALVT